MIEDTAKLNRLMSELPEYVIEIDDDEKLYLYIQRSTDSAGTICWLAFYSAEDDGQVANGLLTGASTSLILALEELLHSYNTDFKKWKEEQ